jgi:hypothetical protein
MKHKFFRVPAHGGDAEVELNQFLAAHRILAVERQFVADARFLSWPMAAGPRRKGKGPDRASSRRLGQRERSVRHPHVGEAP